MLGKFQVKSMHRVIFLAHCHVDIATAHLIDDRPLRVPLGYISQQVQGLRCAWLTSNLGESLADPIISPASPLGRITGRGADKVGRQMPGRFVGEGDLSASTELATERNGSLIPLRDKTTIFLVTLLVR